MHVEAYREYCLAKVGVTESFPFGKLPTVLVFKVAGKMFTAARIDPFESFSVKCNPDQIDELRATYEEVNVQPYMHKRHWNNVRVDGTLSDEMLKSWIDLSYELVVQQLPKQQRQALAG